MGLGAVTLALAILVVIAWLVYVIGQSRSRRRRREAAAPNLAPFLTDDELETTRLDRVLASALIASALLAVALPVYFLNESNRQVAAAETFEEIAVERGEHWYEEFQCGDCHGPAGGGGGAAFVERRSQIATTWAAPAVDDVLYRYDEDEVRYWLIYGRQGSPMPAWGIEGGGPLNTQQIDELIAYLDHIRISQEEAVAAVDARVDRELARLDGADEAVAAAIEAQEAEIASLEDVPARLEATGGLPAALEDVLAAPGLCTEESALLVGKPCDDDAADGDRDGLSDGAEPLLTDLLAQMIEEAPPSDARSLLQQIAAGAPEGAPAFDPANPYSTTTGGVPTADLDNAESMIAEFTAITRDLALTNENLDRLLATARSGLDYLEEAADAGRYRIDFDQIAADAFDGNAEEARRAAGLYNAYCARCHTAGYSAGIAFTQEAGSGAFGPSLRAGRSVVQFPDIADQIDFIVKGSQNGQGYGVNGIGRGWMPGFGATLTEEDIRLIVEFERALP
jgi:mono/diheme cytochrome c family protein